MTAKIRLSEICKRLLFRYYPMLALLGLTTNYSIKIYNIPGVSLSLIYLLGQIFYIYCLSLIVLALYTFKPVGFFNRLIVMALISILGVLISYIGFALIFDFNPFPFFGPKLSSNMFLIMLMSGIWSIGLVILAERGLIAEKEYEEEKTGRVLSEKQLVENRLNLLQAQIEPRFLFNTMKSISDLFDTAPEKVKVMQMHFIQYLRATLAKTRERITTIEQEIELIHSYLDIYRVSLEERLEYHFDIDPQTRDLPFPSMLIQPVVENAIKHGLEMNPEGGRISISVQKSDDMIHVEIADTGNGLNKEGRIKIILSDVRERIRSLIGDKGSLRFEENQPSGLIVIIEIPHG